LPFAALALSGFYRKDGAAMKEKKNWLTYDYDEIMAHPGVIEFKKIFREHPGAFKQPVDLRYIIKDWEEQEAKRHHRQNPPPEKITPAFKELDQNIHEGFLAFLKFSGYGSLLCAALSLIFLLISQFTFAHDFAHPLSAWLLFIAFGLGVLWGIALYTFARRNLQKDRPLPETYADLTFEPSSRLQQKFIVTIRFLLLKTDSTPENWEFVRTKLSNALNQYFLVLDHIPPYDKLDRDLDELLFSGFNFRYWDLKTSKIQAGSQSPPLKPPVAYV
jgi:hypothetical protein